AEGIREPHGYRSGPEHIVQSPRISDRQPARGRAAGPRCLWPYAPRDRELARGEAMRQLKTLQWAARAIRNEVFAFRLDYAIEHVPSAGPKDSLHYYIFSKRLFSDAMKLDVDGIPIHRSRTFSSYNPAYIAWYALVQLECWLRDQDAAALSSFLRQVQ